MLYEAGTNAPFENRAQIPGIIVEERDQNLSQAPSSPGSSVARSGAGFSDPTDSSSVDSAPLSSSRSVAGGAGEAAPSTLAYAPLPTP